MIIGIDPGARAGAVALVRDGFAEVHDLPVFDAGEVDVIALADILSGDSATHVWIEKVGAMPKQGVSSTWKFAKAVGAIEAAVSLSGIPFSHITPAKWKAHFRLAREKDAARQRAIQLFPKLAAQLARKKDEHRAEALLIAAYGKAQ